MQVTRQASKRRSGLRFWNRALGTKANRKTPHTRQPLTRVTLWGCLVGLMLATGIGWAHTGPITSPTCAGAPASDDFATGEMQTLDVATIDDITLKAGDGTEGQTGLRYGKIEVPPLTAGDLTLTIDAATSSPIEAVLCQGTQSVARSMPTYEAAHTTADAAATQADTAQQAATRAAATADLTDTAPADLDRPLRDAKRALERAIDALEDADDTADTTAYDGAVTAIDTELALSPLVKSSAKTALEGAATQLTALAVALRATQATHTGLSLAHNVISGVEEYILVVSHAAATAPTAVGVAFTGIRAQGADVRASEPLGELEPTVTYTFNTNTAGLLMADTTGRAAKGELTVSAADTTVAGVDTATGKVGIVAPLGNANGYVLTITDEGDSGIGTVMLQLMFHSAENLDSGGATYVNQDDTRIDDTLAAGGTDYYFFTLTAAQLLMINTIQPESDDETADTMGTLYSRSGQVKMDIDAEGGMNFKFTAHVSSGSYILKVAGDTPQEAGLYGIRSMATAAAGEYTVPSVTALTVGTGALTAEAEEQHFIIRVEEAGWLQMRVVAPASGTLPTDTNGVLAGPDGMTVVSAPNPEQQANFAAEVMVGLHLLTISGDAGAYGLVVNFIETVALIESAPTVPGVGTEELALQCEADERYVSVSHEHPDLLVATNPDFEPACREADFVRIVTRTVTTGGGGGGGAPRNIPPSEAACREYNTVDTDATGYLENPSGYRSGISVISGWACSANRVTLAVYDSDGERVQRMQAAYGTSRPDTAGMCDHDHDLTGFGMTYNFNHLPEGTYTMRALADNELIGSPQSFMVVHLTEFAANDNDRFLRDLAGQCTVEDFPEIGQETDLEWEQNIQNFVIHEVADVSMAQ